MRSERIFGVGFPRAESGRNPRSRIPDSARSGPGLSRILGGAGFLEFYGGAGFAESGRLYTMNLQIAKRVFDFLVNPTGFHGFTKKTRNEFIARQGL